jgi:hypothetical protein
MTIMHAINRSALLTMLTLVMALCPTGMTQGQSKPWDDAPKGIKVFILAGQSNMVGYGKSEDGGNPQWIKGGKEPKEIKAGLGSLRYLAMHDKDYPQFDYATLLEDPRKPDTSPWKTRKDVKIWWRNGHSAKLGGPISKGDLGPKFQGANNNWFGPEFAFGHIIGDFYKTDDVLIIKAAWGGHSLASNFRSPTAVKKRGGEVGASYQAIFAQAHEVLDNLGTEFPEWKGKGYQIVGFAWHQGFNDRVTPDQSQEYKDNLPDFIADVRAEFGKPSLPFVIASTGMDTAGKVEKPPYAGYTEVEKAQLWVAGVEKPKSVLSTDTRPFWRSETQSPSSMGYHWNHSGECYFLVGKALADDMVKLLEKP